MRALLKALLAILLSAANPAWAQADTPIVAAASDLSFAIEDIARQFARDSGGNVKLVLGSSGNFRRQIAEGAPFELFLSADEAFVLDLRREGRTLDAGVLYAVGRLVLFAPHGSPLAPDAGLRGLAGLVAAGRIERFAIANPEHAPYGRAAREALISVGLWEKLQGRLVLGENVSQAAQFATSPSTQGGIFAYSLVLAPNVARLGRHALLPEAMHAPLRQRMVLLKSAGDTAKAFYAFLQAPAARAVFRKYGFALPGE